MIKKERAEFLDMLIQDDSFRSSELLAVCLTIPPGVLNKEVANDTERDRIINHGEEILLGLNNGTYARIGWSSYFCLTEGDVGGVRQFIKRVTDKAALSDKNHALWNAGVALVGNRSFKEVFEELEMSLNKDH